MSEVAASATSRAILILNNLTNHHRRRAQRNYVNEAARTEISVDFTVPHPQLWWPNGLGDHPLYDFQAQVIIQRRLIDQKRTRIGLRTLELAPAA